MSACWDDFLAANPRPMMAGPGSDAIGQLDASNAAWDWGIKTYKVLDCVQKTPGFECDGTGNSPLVEGTFCQLQGDPKSATLWYDVR